MIPPVIVPITFKDIKEIIKNKSIGLKDNILKFEDEISFYNNCENSILTYSGRTALYILLKAYGLNKGDEVMMPAFMCETVSQVFYDMGLKLNFIDVNPNTYNMDIDDLNKKINKNTKAILAVHLFGIPCNIDSIMEIAEDNNSLVIEDAAQAMGAEYKDKKVGTIADAGFFSFGRGKPMTAMGGGAIVTHDNIIAGKCRTIIESFKQKSFDLFTAIQLVGYSSLRNRGIYHVVHKKVRSEKLRVNINLDNLKYKITDFQAIIGMNQLQKLDIFNLKRRNNAEFLMREFRKNNEIRIPKVINHSKPIFLRFPIQIGDQIMRNHIMYLLENKGIETSIVYPTPLPNIYGHSQDGYYGTDNVVKKIIALPTHPNIQEKDLKIIVKEIGSHTSGEL